MPDPPELPAEIRKKLSAMGITATAAQRELMEQLSAKSRDSAVPETDVDDLQHAGEDRPTAVAFFRSLSDAGAGTFKAGRRQMRSRIVWSYSAADIATAFLDDTAVSSLAAPHRAEEQDERQAQFYPHTFLLRRSMQVSVSLPLDLTREEANRLAEFIRALPF